jgi:septal ring factor EnvC (AmiA/AmiB activator)
MTNGKKILIAIITSAVLLGVGILAGYGIRKAVDNKRFREYRNTVDSLGSQITELTNYNRDLEEAIKRAGQRIGELGDSLRLAQSRVEASRKLIEELGKDLSGAVGDVRAIIRSIRRVIQKVSQLGEKEQHPDMVSDRGRGADSD